MLTLTKKQRDKLAYNLRKAGLLSGSLQVAERKAQALEDKRSHLTPKQLRDTANVHIGNKLLKPDAGFYKPDGNTRTMANLKSGKTSTKQYKVPAPKKQKGAGIYKRNPTV